MMHFRDGDRQFQLSSDSDREGVIVDLASPAPASGLTPGDVITGVGTATVADLASLQDALKALNGSAADLQVRNDGKSRSVRVSAKEYSAWIPPDSPTPPSPPSRGAAANSATTDSRANALTATISALDEQVFDAFNRCKDPAQLQRHAGYFADDVEFYHDTGGVTWTRAAMLDNTARHVCGNIRRERVVGTLKVYPVKDFGAIEQGVHRFCRIDTGDCDGMADFMIVWKKLGENWQITRVLSYGHRSSTEG